MTSQNLYLEISESEPLDPANGGAWRWLDEFYEKHIESELKANRQHGGNHHHGFFGDVGKLFAPS